MSEGAYSYCFKTRAKVLGSLFWSMVIFPWCFEESYWRQSPRVIHVPDSHNRLPISSVPPMYILSPVVQYFTRAIPKRLNCSSFLQLLQWRSSGDGSSESSRLTADITFVQNHSLHLYSFPTTIRNVISILVFEFIPK